MAVDCSVSVSVLLVSYVMWSGASDQKALIFFCHIIQ